MIALAGVTVALAVGLGVAIWQAVLLADQNAELRDQRDRATRDRAMSARALTALSLLEVAYDLGAAADRVLRDERATETARRGAEAQREIADWIETIRVPALSRPVNAGGVV